MSSKSQVQNAHMALAQGGTARERIERAQHLVGGAKVALNWAHFLDANHTPATVQKAQAQRRRS